MSMLIEIKQFILNNMNLLTIVVGLTASIFLWIKGKGALSLRGYIPTLWTSLGILGTFVAIYFGLSDYSSGESAPELNILIKKVIPAFSTSIIGIIGAIISTIFNRWANDNLERADYEQFVKIKNKIPGHKIQSSSPEMVLLEIISAIRETSNQTCEKLKNNNDTSGKKLEQIQSKLTTIDSTASVVGDRIKTAITDSMSKQREEITSAISLLISTLSSELKLQSDTLATKMDDLRRMLHEEVKHIEITNETLITKLIDKEEKLLDLTTQTLLKDSETRNNALQNFITKQSADLEESFGEITAGMGALYQKIDENISTHIEEEKELFEHEIKDSIEEFAKAQYKTCTDTISRCNEELTANTERIHQEQINTSNAFIAKLEDIFTNISEVFSVRIKELSENVVDKLAQLNDGNLNVLENTVTQNRQEVQRILDTHSEDIRVTAQQIKAEQSQFRDILADEYSKMQGKMLDQFNRYLGQIGVAMDETRQLLENDSKNVAEITTLIRDALMNLSADISKFNVEFMNNLDAVKTQVIESAGKLSNDIQRTIANSTQIKQLEATALKITEAVDKSINSMNEGLERVSAVIDSSVGEFEKSAQIYSDSVTKSDMVTRYMEGTSNLFKEHNNAISILEKSLSCMMVSINQMKDALMSYPSHKNSSGTSKK